MTGTEMKRKAQKSQTHENDEKMMKKARKGKETEKARLE